MDARGVEKGAALGPFTALRLTDDYLPELRAELNLLRADAIKAGCNWRMQRRPVSKWTALADRYWIEADATVMPVSLRFGFNALEFVDWLLGWGGLDALGDDRHVNRTAAEERVEE